MGLGPVIVGVLSDALTSSLAEQAIRWAMVISLLTVVIGSLLYWRSAEPYKRAVLAGGANHG